MEDVPSRMEEVLPPIEAAPPSKNAAATHKNREKVYYCLATDQLSPAPDIQAADLATKAAIDHTLAGLDITLAKFELPSSSPASAESPIPETITDLCNYVSEFSPARPSPSKTWTTTQNWPDQELSTAVSASNLWIFLTEGKEETNNEPLDFITHATRIGAQHTPCIIVIYVRPPAAPFMAYTKMLWSSTHCLVSWFCVYTHQIYVVQARGCFAHVVGGRPTVDSVSWNTSNWTDLARFKWQDLARVDIPVVGERRKLVVCGGGVYTEGEVKEWEQMREVRHIFDAERLREIVGMAERQVHIKVPFLEGGSPVVQLSNGILRLDIGDRAEHAFRMLFFNLDLKMSGQEDVPLSRIEAYRNDLRAANRANQLHYEVAMKAQIQQKFTRDFEHKQSFLLPTLEKEETFIPGFVRAVKANRKGMEHRGRCCLCLENGCILTVILHSHPNTAGGGCSVHGVSEVFNRDWILCEMCAFWVDEDVMFLDKPVLAALPLVSVMDNAGKYLGIFKALKDAGGEGGEGRDERRRDDAGELMEFISTATAFLDSGFGSREGRNGIEMEGAERSEFGKAMGWLAADLMRWLGVTESRGEVVVERFGSDQSAHSR